MTQKQKLNEAVELLEQLYFKVYNGCSYKTGEPMRLIPDIHAQHDIATFVKSVKKDSEIITPKLPTCTQVC